MFNIRKFLYTITISTLITALPVNGASAKQTETAFDKQQIECLAQNVYFEAGNQSRTGKIAVSNVVMNRVNDKRFPNTPCAVIKQKARGVCQFSWVCQGKKYIRDQKTYAEALSVARRVYDNAIDVTNGAKFYHASYVKPSWSRVFKRTVVIGDHIFYKG